MKMTNSGGSASPTSSSGAPSSSSILADADEKEQFLQNQLIQSGLAGNQWMSMLLQQQQQNMQTEATSPTKPKAELSDIIQNPAAIMEFLNGNEDLAKFAAQIAQNNKMVSSLNSRLDSIRVPRLRSCVVHGVNPFREIFWMLKKREHIKNIFSRLKVSPFT